MIVENCKLIERKYVTIKKRMTNVTNDKLQNHIDLIIFCQMATFFNGKKVNNFGKK